MKVALLHDTLSSFGSPEKILFSLSQIFPDSPIYTLLYNEKTLGSIFPKSRIISYGLEKNPLLRLKYKERLSLLHSSKIETFDFGGFDIVISVNSGFSHAAITSLNTKHISYFAVNLENLWNAKNIFNHYTRIWNFYASKRADTLIANSKHSQNCIKKYYKRDSILLYPPANTTRFTAQKEHENYFLMNCQSITDTYNIELVIKLFNKIGRKLLILGDFAGQDFMKSIAAPNIEFIGTKNEDLNKEYIQNCRAFIAPQEENFAISIIEAMAAGKPVLASNKNISKEIIMPNVNGELFYEDNLKSIEDSLGILLLNENKYNHLEIAKHASNFSEEKFKKGILDCVGKTHPNPSPRSQSRTSL